MTRHHVPHECPVCGPIVTRPAYKKARAEAESLGIPDPSTIVGRTTLECSQRVLEEIEKEQARHEP